MMQSELFLDVRYYETDQMGIVHHSNYVRYFECGRTDMLKKLGLPIEKIEDAAGLPLINYVPFDETLTDSKKNNSLYSVGTIE